MAKKEKFPELGDLARSGALVAGYLRAIGAEKDVIVECEGGKPKLVSKAEALARDIWAKALNIGVDENLCLKYRELLLNRAEGRPGITGELGTQTIPIPDRISETNKKRLNAMVV